MQGRSNYPRGNHLSNDFNFRFQVFINIHWIKYANEIISIKDHWMKVLVSQVIYQHATMMVWGLNQFTYVLMIFLSSFNVFINIHKYAYYTKKIICINDNVHGL